MQAGVGRPLAALVLRSERRERSSGSELQDRRTEVAERVCKHTRTHYGFCSLPLANPALDERQSRSDCIVSTLSTGRRFRRGTEPCEEVEWP